jgi:hypothetical protein
MWESDDAMQWFRDLKEQWLYAGTTDIRLVDLRAPESRVI